MIDIMKGAAIFAVFVVSALHYGVSAGKPRIISPAQSEFLIQEGDELRIQCQGEGKLQFSTQRVTASMIEQSKIEIFSNNDSGIYTLIRRSAMNADTGWYACAEEGIEIINNEQTIVHPSERISWIYVYVNSSRPFAVMEGLFEPLLVIRGNDLVVPCRPTSPNLPVMVEINDGNEPMPKDTMYDPRIGFVFHNIGLERSGEIYACKLNRTDESDEWPFYAVHVADNKPLLNPVINLPRSPHAVWGEDLVLECILNVDRPIQYMLNWTLPSSVSPGRYQSKLILNHQPGTIRTWKRELVVKNVQKSDDGNYTCTATGIVNKAQSSIEIKTRDPRHTHVNARVIGMEAMTIHERSDVQWRIEIDMRSEDFSWEWYKPNGVQIRMTESGPDARYSHTVDGISHEFKISNVGIDDSGNYILRVSTAHNTKNITLSLRVVGAPFILPVSSSSFYSPGSRVTFSSLTFGFPLPTVEWIYKEYPDFPSKENYRSIPLSDVYNERSEDTPFRMTSNVNLMINKTGDLICVSCNEVNCTESTKLIFVSADAAFGINGPGQVTEGDDVNVTCGASVYHAKTISWRRKSFGSHAFDWTRVNITERKTNSTLQSTLHIREVQESDAGQYVCVARNEEGNDNKFVYKLAVEHPQPAALSHSNMNETELSIDLKRSKNKAVTLECYVEGRPIPKVTWYKNGELIEESKQYRFSDNSSRLQIAYFSDAKADSGRYSCIGTNRFSTVETYMDIKVADPENHSSSMVFDQSGAEKQGEILSNHDSNEDLRGMSLTELQRVCLTKQIRAAEAQERAAISLERMAKTAKRFIEQFSNRFFQ